MAARFTGARWAATGLGRFVCALAMLGGPAASGCAGREREQAEPRPAPTTAATPRAQAPVAAKPKTSEPPPIPAAPRVYAKTRFVWIRPEPDATMQWIGFMWIGGSSELASTTPRTGPGCKAWYGIKPRGYVCVDGDAATLDPNDPTLVKIRPYAPDLSSPWPHQYAESRGADRFRAVPSGTGKELRFVDPFGFGKLPTGIYENRTRLRPLSTFAYSKSTEVDGSEWLLSHDLMWVAKERVTPYPKIEFHGVELGTTARLPLAFFRGKARPKYQRGASGELGATGGEFARLSYVELTGERVTQGDDAFLLTREAGVFVRERDAVVPKPQEKTPWGAPVGAPDPGPPRRGRATWLEVSVWDGWLIAYEGTRPVFTTLISPGRGGTPVPDKDPLETASTPTGTFKITGKFATATMEAPNEFIHSDVPWTQNFSGPHAIHGAYWHDDWGNRKSAGCVTGSPIDGRWLFHFTEPVVPDGWHGLRWQPSLEPATTLIIHR